MTEPPRPPGESGSGSPQDPASSPPSAGGYSTPGETPAPGYPPPAPPPHETPAPGYAPPQYETPAPGYAADPPPGSPPPGGYGGAGGYPPPGGYPPGGYPTGGYGPGYGGPAPAGYANGEEKTWALIAHFGGPVAVIVGAGLLGWVPPLIAMLAKGPQSPTVRAHSVAALNFQITWAIVLAASWVLTAVTCGILFFIPAIIWVVPVIFGIIGGVKANDGQLYRYPMTYNFAK
ncbi:DUF4870 domain-containing protein [Micromonospora sp. NPDC049559]|uniref:DUF4870 domain-containing protein n=1 Tax=Micromonospora sp. NPDC049559 TaxID=3155923 RepID=UPI00341F959D